MAARPAHTKRRNALGRLRAAYAKACRAMQTQAERWESAVAADPRSNLMQDVLDADWGAYLRPLLDAWEEAAEAVWRRAFRAAVKEVRASKHAHTHAEKDARSALTPTQLSLQEELAARFVESQGLLLAQSQENAAQDATRRLLGNALRDGRGVAEAAREMRQHIGLHDQDSRALERFRANAVKAGMKPKALEKAVERRRARLIRQRADLVARTELAMARERGRLGAWVVLQDTGEMSPRIGRRLVPRDACPRCLAIAAMPPVPLKGLFSSADGSFVSPPLHPRCDCGQELVELSAVALGRSTQGGLKLLREPQPCCLPGQSKALRGAPGKARPRTARWRDRGGGPGRGWR